MGNYKSFNISKVCKIVTTVAIVVVGAIGICWFLVVGAGVFISVVSREDLFPKSFSSAAWKQLPTSTQVEEDRQAMFRDLINRYQLVGMAENYLIDLLGQGDG